MNWLEMLSPAFQGFKLTRLGSNKVLGLISGQSGPFGVVFAWVSPAIKKHVCFYCQCPWAQV